jgi:hypothetical protein
VTSAGGYGTPRPPSPAPATTSCPPPERRRNGLDEERARLRYLGGSGKVAIATQIPVSGPRTITVDYEIDGQREIKVSSNGTLILTRTVTGSSWDVPQTFRFIAILNAGSVLLTLYNDTSPAPDIDKIIIS